ncbi:hypothetical protein COT97_03105 [Candidatus Falkowbacteria bacterium CG10_big_fil_rev_8_21_14_0_10_39_11]|uniref:Uncharacterized protein n=1 Tax=Candidatus Falkowbacteria bacterium CG10_big_fil_rev_8_21_14_0_10_39_11 TaxID=1974565 RepID=A0A2H0V6X7_9BACT|nr:MAG: hypothetical protein COT97_03105 [Candidatus Falkowbacteria bacterium CG10_big_fil_rev_8_21_14_0_10_39_11]
MYQPQRRKPMSVGRACFVLFSTLIIMAALTGNHGCGENQTPEQRYETHWEAERQLCDFTAFINTQKAYNLELGQVYDWPEYQQLLKVYKESAKQYTSFDTPHYSTEMSQEVALKLHLIYDRACREKLAGFADTQVWDLYDLWNRLHETGSSPR